MTYTVVNVRREECDVYCGRKEGTILGNPFTSKEYPNGKAIQLYREWLVNKIRSNDWKVVDELLRIHEMHEKNGSVKLGCWCKPKGCHVDVIVEVLEKESIIQLLEKLSKET